MNIYKLKENFKKETHPETVPSGLLSVELIVVFESHVQSLLNIIAVNLFLLGAVTTQAKQPSSSAFNFDTSLQFL